MNTNYIFVFFSILFSSSNLAAQCPSNNLIISSQAQLNDFKTTYPDCTNLEVNLSLLSSNSITDLSPLDGLQSMPSLYISGCNVLFIADISEDLEIGSLTIRECPILESARIINNVVANGDLSLHDLPKLSVNEPYIIERVNNLSIRNLRISSLSKFPNLIRVNDRLTLAENSNLTDISLLSDVELNSIDINNNPSLESCAIDAICNLISEDVDKILLYNNGFECTYLQQIIDVCHPDTTICYLKALNVNKQRDLDYLINIPDQCIDSIGIIGISSHLENDIADLSNLIRFKELQTLIIDGATELTTLKGLDSLKSVVGFGLSDNDNLESLEGLGNLKEISGAININWNPKLASISSEHLLPDIIQAAYISGPVSDITAFSNIDSLKGFVLNQTQVENFDWAQGIHFSNEFVLNGNINLEGVTLGNFDHSINWCEINNNCVLKIVDGLAFNDTTYTIYFEDNPLTTLQNIRGPKHAISGMHILNTELKNIPSWEGFENASFLRIGGNDQLESIELLKSLNKIETLSIIHNDKLTSLGSLPADIQVIEKLVLSNNAILQDISILDGEGRINDISIRNNPMLEVCDILPICKEYKEIYPDIVFEGNGGNCNLVDLNFDCEWGQNAYGDVIVKSQNDLDSIRSLFPLMDGVNGNLILDFSLNSDDIDYSYFDNIGYVRDILEIRHPKEDNVFERFAGSNVGGLLLTNIDIPSLDILEYKDILQQFRLTNVQGLTDFKGLENVSFIRGKIDIVNTSITSTNGLDSLESISSVQFVDCPNLTNINSLSSVSSIRDLRLAVLPEFNDFAWFDGMDLPRYLQFNTLPHLTKFPTFIQDTSTILYMVSTCHGLTHLSMDSLVHVQDRLSIFGNDNLESVSFKKFKTAKDFSVVANNIIEEIDVPQMDTVYSMFHIALNESLENLDGINSTMTTPNFTLTRNPNLEDCNMELICNNYFVGSNLTIEENLGCETAEEITENCTVSTDNKDFFLLKAYPNPVSNTLYLEGNYDSHSLALYNALGQSINIKIESNQIDVNSLTRGIYYLKLSDSKTSSVITIVKE